MVDAVPQSAPYIDVVRYGIVAISGTIVFILMNYSIELPRKKDKESASSFFKIRDVLPRVGVLSLKIWYSLPPAILFVILATYSRPLVDSVIEQIVKDNKPASDAFKQIHSTAPELDSLLLLIFLLALFAPVMKIVVVSVRDVLLNVSGLYGMIDECSIDAAASVLKSTGDYEAALEKIRHSGPRPPLPEELASGSDSERLSYQILWLVAGSQLTRARGSREAIADLLRRSGIQVRISPSIEWPDFDVWASQLIAGGFVFIVLIGLYIVCVPNLWYLTNFDWPRPGYRSNLVFYTLQRLLGYLIPVGICIPLFLLRLRRDRSTDEGWNSLVFIMALSAIMSFLVNSVFKLVEIARSISGSFNLGNTLGFFQEKNFIDVFLTSLTPAVALASWYFLRRLGKLRRFSTAIEPLVMGLWFALSQLLYDLNARAIPFRRKIICSSFKYHGSLEMTTHCVSRLQGRFIHQFLFGFFITISFILCIFIVQKGTRRWTQSDSDASMEAIG